MNKDSSPAKTDSTSAKTHIPDMPSKTTPIPKPPADADPKETENVPHGTPPNAPHGTKNAPPGTGNVPHAQPQNPYHSSPHRNAFSPPYPDVEFSPYSPTSVDPPPSTNQCKPPPPTIGQSNHHPT